MAENTLGRVEGQLLNMNETLQKIERCLFGNGQPGAMERITRIEENLEKLSEDNNAQTKNIEKLSESISELKKIVELHHSDKAMHSLWGLTGRKQTLIWLMVIFAGFHAIISMFPDISILIRFLLKLVGITIP